VWLILCAIPCVAWLYFLWRLPPHRTSAFAAWGTAVLGAFMGVASSWIQRFVVELTGLEQAVSTFGAPSGLLYFLVFAAPLAEGAKVLAAWPALRSAHVDERYDGFLFASASSCGFAASQSAVALLSARIDIDVMLRVMLLLIAHPLMSSFWGHALGKMRRFRIPTGSFILSWTLATLVHGLLLHLTRSTSWFALVAAFPVLGGLAFATGWAARDLLARFAVSARPSRQSMLSLLPSPSLHAVRHALRRTDRPIMVHWIVVGALTTTGVMLTMVVLAVWFGHQVGLDFSAIEREDTTARAIVPLVLITVSILAAFPVSGYLITKASGSDNVLEPALSATLAIAAVLIMLGIAAPVALVFALAFAPIAFGLACSGAWFGLDK